MVVRLILDCSKSSASIWSNQNLCKCISISTMETFLHMPRMSTCLTLHVSEQIWKLICGIILSGKHLKQ
ncbi:hypothetical protein ACSBR1_016751 [Camellia fascicularis]